MSLIKCPECNADISDKAKSCPHCGFPIVKSTEKEYSLIFRPQPTESGLANCLKVLSWLVWIAGLILSFAGAYDGDTFYFVGFFVDLIGFFIGGMVLMALSVIVEKIVDVHALVYGIELKKSEEHHESQK